MDSIVLSIIEDLEGKAGYHVKPEPTTNVLTGNLFVIGNQLATFCLDCGKEVDNDIERKEDVDQIFECYQCV